MGGRQQGGNPTWQQGAAVANYQGKPFGSVSLPGHISTGSTIAAFHHQLSKMLLL